MIQPVAIVSVGAEKSALVVNWRVPLRAYKVGNIVLQDFYTRCGRWADNIPCTTCSCMNHTIVVPLPIYLATRYD